jgi:DNA sulfur modification protein DndB
VATIISGDPRITKRTSVAGSRHSGDFEYTFPAIRGVQAGREYYVTMCPLRLVVKLLVFEDPGMTAEHRAQRNLNRARVPEIARYITENPESYVFSALTASVDADIRFDPYGDLGADRRVGTLTIPMSARFVINDGQHRRAAIQRALEERPELADESIAIVFFLDLGLQRCQQMFADLNRHAIRPAKSLGVLYDHRDVMSAITRLMVWRSPLLRELTDAGGAGLSLRSRKLFTLSSFYTANRALLEGTGEQPIERRADAAAEYWDVVSAQFPEWGQVYEGVLAAGGVRREYIHTHGIVLHALGRVGNELLGADLDPKRRGMWQRKLRGLSSLDWRRSTGGVWEGRATTGGVVCKSNAHVLLTTAAIRTALGLPLPPAEARAEEGLRGGDS